MMLLAKVCHYTGVACDKECALKDCALGIACDYKGILLPAKVEPERVDHPAHYGGADNPYEAIKVIDAWGLGFALGNAVKYICRAPAKGSTLEDLRKARWYLDHEIEVLTAKAKEIKNEAVS